MSGVTAKIIMRMYCRCSRSAAHQPVIPITPKKPGTRNTGKSYYITTLAGWQRHATGFADSHWIALDHNRHAQPMHAFLNARWPTFALTLAIQFVPFVRRRGLKNKSRRLRPPSRCAAAFGPSCKT
jgi:hypothetical protein